MNNEIHLINKAKYMSNIIFDLTDNELPKKLNILDFGCGDGLFAEKLGQNGFNLFGTDIKDFWNSNDNIDKSKFKQINQDSNKIPFDDNSFDIVCS
tara:strand:+ start:3481 stop:3768 length:288 start_codon:yes stop_codon:yes gene_type:complete